MALDLDAFLEQMPSDVWAAFEFRNASWLADDVYDRLRDEGYQESDIGEWAETIRQQATKWRDVFVYFKHEEAGKGPEFAQLLTGMLS